MNYLVVIFVNKDPTTLILSGFHPNLVSAVQAAETHVTANTADSVHIYEWSCGYEARIEVTVDRQWQCPEPPPAEPQDPAAESPYQS